MRFLLVLALQIPPGNPYFEVVPGKIFGWYPEILIYVNHDMLYKLIPIMPRRPQLFNIGHLLIPVTSTLMALHHVWRY